MPDREIPGGAAPAQGQQQTQNTDPARSTVRCTSPDALQFSDELDIGRQQPTEVMCPATLPLEVHRNGFSLPDRHTELQWLLHVPPLSTVPSQSSSMPLHVSTPGDPGVALHAAAPVRQIVLPVARQAPTPAVQDVPRTRQDPPQSSEGEGQDVPHAPPLHVAEPPDGAAQRFAHVPQLAGSRLVSTQLPLHGTAGDVHTSLHEPATHASLDAHAWKQLPQLEPSIDLSTHRDPQIVRGERHCVRQAPPEHSCPDAHAFAHAPQFEGSEPGSTHDPLHTIRGAAHTARHASALQACPDGQTRGALTSAH